MTRKTMKSAKVAVVFAALGVVCVATTGSAVVSEVRAAAAPKQEISADASAAIAQMEKSLQSEQFSFRFRILRVYPGPNGQPLHIAHSMKVVVHRPDRMTVDVTGDDGSTKLVYDGKLLTMLGVETNKYATIPVPNTIQGMLDVVSEQNAIDFPVADFLNSGAGKSVLLGVTSAKEVNTVTIDGVPCRHLLLTQPPGVEVELWVEKNDRSLPRRLIITYRTMSGHPSVVAELFDWDLSIRSPDSTFVFQPPKDAVLVELKAPTIVKPTKSSEAKP